MRSDCERTFSRAWAEALAVAVGALSMAWAVAEEAPLASGPMPRWRRVEVTIDVDGDLHGPAAGTAEPGREPITMQARFAFLESPRPGDLERAALRRYTTAAATIDVAGKEQALCLPADARSIAVARVGTTPLPYLPASALTRDELELLETPFDSLLLEDLLPAGPVAEGDEWSLPGDLAAGLLAIDTVETGGIDARIVALADGTARITFAGVVDGAVDGVPTHVMVEGSCSAGAEPDEDGHMLVGDVTRLDTVVRERRQAGHVAAGFEIEARLSVKRTDVADGGFDADSETGADETTAAFASRRGPGTPGMIWYRDPEGRFDLVHDSGWRCVGEDAGGLMLRLLDLGALVAQCSITSLPRSPDAGVPSVEEVKRHVEQSLSGQFKRFADAAATVREEDGARIIRVVSEGNAEGLPFRWVHYVLTDADGHRVNVTFMYEASLEQRFADGDATVVAGLRFGADAHREARLPRKTRVP